MEEDDDDLDDGLEDLIRKAWGTCRTANCHAPQALLGFGGVLKFLEGHLLVRDNDKSLFGGPSWPAGFHCSPPGAQWFKIPLLGKGTLSRCRKASGKLEHRERCQQRQDVGMAPIGMTDAYIN